MCNLFLQTSYNNKISFYNNFVLEKKNVYFSYFPSILKVKVLYPIGSAVNQPAFPFASYSTRAGNLVSFILIFILYVQSLILIISPEGTTVNQPAYTYASYSTQSGDPVTNLHALGNYPTQYSTGTNPQPQYQHSFQPPPQPSLYEEPEKVPSSPPPSYDQVN